MSLYIIAAIVVFSGLAVTAFTDLPDPVEDFIIGLSLAAGVILCYIGVFV